MMTSLLFSPCTLRALSNFISLLEEPLKFSAHKHIFEGDHYGNKQFSPLQHVECGEGGAQVECSDVAHMRYCMPVTLAAPRMIMEKGGNVV